jgi:hypothetical protein
MLVFEIAGKEVRTGAVLAHVAGGLAIVVGETGRGRQAGMLPVVSQTETERIETVTLADANGSTIGVASDPVTSSGAALLVMRSSIGYRGGNQHHGDLDGEPCAHAGRYWNEDVAPVDGCCPLCGVEVGVYSSKHPPARYLPFPGEVLATGRIAQGTAGRMGSGEQLIAVMPRGVWFGVTRSGRLYGAPARFWYRFNGETVEVYTDQERRVLEATEQIAAEPPHADTPLAQAMRAAGWTDERPATRWCGVPGCETEAVWVAERVDDDPLYMCAQCASAFELGQLQPDCGCVMLEDYE